MAPSGSSTRTTANLESRATFIGSAHGRGNGEHQSAHPHSHPAECNKPFHCTRDPLHTIVSHILRRVRDAGGRARSNPRPYHSSRNPEAPGSGAPPQPQCRNVHRRAIPGTEGFPFELPQVGSPSSVLTPPVLGHMRRLVGETISRPKKRLSTVRDASVDIEVSMPQPEHA